MVWPRLLCQERQKKVARTEGFISFLHLIKEYLGETAFIQRLKAGEEAAFRELVDQFRQPVYNTVLNLLHDSAEAEDTAQEVFIRVYEYIHRFREEALLSTWIYKIAVRSALEKLRKQKRRSFVQRWLPGFNAGIREPESCYHPGVQAENKEKAARLFNAIARLPEQQQLAFTLIRLQGLTYAETALIMEKNIKAVESLMSRAKENLQEQLIIYHPKNKTHG